MQQRKRTTVYIIFMRYSWYEYIYCMIVNIVKEARGVLWSIYSCIQAYIPEKGSPAAEKMAY